MESGGPLPPPCNELQRRCVTHMTPSIRLPCLPALLQRLLLYLVGASNQQPQPPQQLAGAAGPLDVGELLVGAGLALRDDRGRKAGAWGTDLGRLSQDPLHAKAVCIIHVQTLRLTLSWTTA